jgi:hypothetical protein
MCSGARHAATEAPLFNARIEQNANIRPPRTLGNMG